MHHKRRSRRDVKINYLSCGCCIDYSSRRKEPIEDGPCTGHPKRKKPRPKKDRCPVNRTHEWYKETVIKPSRWYYSAIYEISTCIHCWKVKEKFKQYLRD